MFENDPVSGRRKSRSPSDSNEGFDKFFRCYRTLIRVIWLQLGFRWQFVLNFSRELYARLKICVTWSQRKLEYRFVLNFLDFGEWFSLQVEILEHFERLMEGFCYSTCQWNLSQPPNLIVGKSPKQCTICTWPRSNDTKPGATFAQRVSLLRLRLLPVLLGWIRRHRPRNEHSVPINGTTTNV